VSLRSTAKRNEGSWPSIEDSRLRYAFLVAVSGESVRLDHAEDPPVSGSHIVARPQELVVSPAKRVNM
jgi:hypothetical protein